MSIYSIDPDEILRYITVEVLNRPDHEGGIRERISYDFFLIRSLRVLVLESLRTIFAVSSMS